jgi:hypothetical protein
MSDVLELIDRTIAKHLAPRICRRRGRGRCQCGHIDLVHRDLSRRGSGEPPRNEGPCSGSSGRCRCLYFVPYSYEKEQQAALNKWRKFAFDLLNEYDKLKGTR